MPTGKQIRAARVLVDWAADDLSARIGLSRESIQSIERGDKRPRATTMEKIVRVFNDMGVEFIGDAGVILKDEELVRFTGENAFLKVLDDVVASSRDQTAPEALFACVIDELSPSIVIENYRRLRKEGIRMRSLVKEGDSYLMGRMEEYRTLPKQFFHNNPMVIYGNKVAFMILNAETKADKMAIILSNPHTASAMRNLFEFIWQHCPQPEKTTAKIKYEQ